MLCFNELPKFLISIRTQYSVNFLFSVSCGHHVVIIINVIIVIKSFFHFFGELQYQGQAQLK